MSQHPYLYANANPTTLVDPTGLSSAQALALVNVPMPEAPLPGISEFEAYYKQARTAQAAAEQWGAQGRGLFPR